MSGERHVAKFERRIVLNETGGDERQGDDANAYFPTGRQILHVDTRGRRLIENNRFRWMAFVGHEESLGVSRH